MFGNGLQFVRHRPQLGRCDCARPREGGGGDAHTGKRGNLARGGFPQGSTKRLVLLAEPRQLAKRRNGNLAVPAANRSSKFGDARVRMYVIHQVSEQRSSYITPPSAEDHIRKRLEGTDRSSAL